MKYFVFCFCAVLVTCAIAFWQRSKAESLSNAHLFEIADAIRAACDTCIVEVDTINGAVVLGSPGLRGVPGHGKVLKLENVDSTLVINQQHTK